MGLFGMKCQVPEQQRPLSTTLLEHPLLVPIAVCHTEIVTCQLVRRGLIGMAKFPLYASETDDGTCIEGHGYRYR